jgi:hypothetical protein
MDVFRSGDAIRIFAVGACITISFMFYLYLGWILPVKKIRDKESEKGTKMFFGVWMFLVGICPILWLMYSGLKGSMSGGNAVSPYTGGTPPPKAVAPAPNVQPSVMAGAAPANIPVVIQNPAGNVAIGKQN